MRPLGVDFAQPGQWAISINRLGREKNSVFGYIARAQRELFRLFSKHGAQNGPPPPCYAYCRSRGGCRPSATAEGCVRLIAQIEQFKLAKLGLLPLGSSPEFLSISRLSSHSSSFAARSLASESFIGSAYTTSSASATRLRHSSSASIFAAGLLFLPQPGMTRGHTHNAVCTYCIRYQYTVRVQLYIIVPVYSTSRYLYTHCTYLHVLYVLLTVLCTVLYK